MPVTPSTHFQDAAIDQMIKLQDRIDGLQRIIASDPTALGINGRIKVQLKRLRSEQIDTAYNALPEGE